MLEKFKKFELDISQEKYFSENVFIKFQEALKKRCVRTLTKNECFFAWSFIKKYQPKVFLELGGQHGHSGIIFADAVKSYGGTFITVELGDSPENKYPIESTGTLEFLPDNDPKIIKVWGNDKNLLPDLLNKYEIEMVFHDSDHTWDHVESCLNIIMNFNKNIIQSCHDCADGLWMPDVTTKYGVICAERPVFDKYFKENKDYIYDVYEDKYGIGFALPIERKK